MNKVTPGTRINGNNYCIKSRCEINSFKEIILKVKYLFYL